MSLGEGWESWAYEDKDCFPGSQTPAWHLLSPCCCAPTLCATRVGYLASFPGSVHGGMWEVPGHSLFFKSCGLQPVCPLSTFQSPLIACYIISILSREEHGKMKLFHLVPKWKFNYTKCIFLNTEINFRRNNTIIENSWSGVTENRGKIFGEKKDFFLPY